MAKPAAVITAGGLRDSEQLGGRLNSQNATVLNAEQSVPHNLLPFRRASA
jgi:hypothetical protein